MKGIEMRKISSVISLSFLFLLLLVSCVKRESHLIKSGDNDWVKKESHPSKHEGDNDWVRYNRDNDGNVYSYKKGNIDKDEGKYIVQIWIKKVYSKKGIEKEIQSRIKNGLSTEGYDKLSHIVSLGDIDCNKRMKQTLSLTRYDTDNKILNSWDYDRKWEHIIPNSNGDNVREIVCKQPLTK
jgi:hypothetical protein